MSQACSWKNRAAASRKALTIIELSLSMAVLSMVAAAVAALATGVRQGSEFARNSAMVTQHARVTADRISRCIESAWATETDPGAVVVHETLGGEAVPIALVVWRPTSGKPVNENGPPLVRELAIFTPDTADPRRLLEVRAPSNSSTVSLESLDSASGRALISSILSSASSQKILLTELLRTTAVSGSSARRGVVWFVRRVLPSSADLVAARTGSKNWVDLPWPQGIYTSTTGVRQTWIRFELQLTPPGTTTANMASQAVPFFGSGAIYYEVRR